MTRPLEAALLEGVDVYAAIAFDFSVLQARLGSVYAASDSIGAALSQLGGKELLAFRQFVYISDPDVDTATLAQELSRLLSLGMNDIGMAEEDGSLDFDDVTEAAWILAASARVERWTRGVRVIEGVSLKEIWTRPSATGHLARSLSTPPPLLQNGHLRPKKLSRPVTLIEERLAANVGQAAVMVDFMGYNRSFNSPAGPVGVGVSDRMERFARDLGFSSLRQSESRRALFELRREQQLVLTRFEGLAARLASSSTASIVPASPDGSPGNDGTLLLVDHFLADELASAIREVARDLGLSPSVTVIAIEGGDLSWLAQGERCLAAQKCAEFWGYDTAQLESPCLACKELAGLRSDSAYVQKQLRVFGDCSWASPSND